MTGIHAVTIVHDACTRTDHIHPIDKKRGRRRETHMYIMHLSPLPPQPVGASQKHKTQKQANHSMTHSDRLVHRPAAPRWDRSIVDGHLHMSRIVSDCPTPFCVFSPKHPNDRKRQRGREGQRACWMPNAPARPYKRDALAGRRPKQSRHGRKRADDVTAHHIERTWGRGVRG